VSINTFKSTFKNLQSLATAADLLILSSCATADRWQVDADLQNVCKFMQHSPVPKL